MPRILIIGSGLAGYTVAREVRRSGNASALTIVTADDGAFYSKPMLSNALAQRRTAESLRQQDAGAMAGMLDATILTGRRVGALYPDRRAVAVDGETLGYDQLVLALGADPIRLPLAGDGAAAVLSVNDRLDYARFREALAGATHVTLLGGGLIGSEFANDLRSVGIAVTVVDPAPWPLGRLVPEAIGRAVVDRLAEIGVAWRLGRTAQRVDRQAGDGLRVQLDDGETIDTSLVLSAVGLRPRTALARAAGLAVNRGIVTDPALETSASGIYALGDCSEFDGLVRPFVMPITHAAKALARTLAGERSPVVFPPMPVVVKTPAIPVVVCPPPASAEGGWELRGEPGHWCARFLTPGGRLLGFALCGAATGEKQALAAALSAA